MAEVAATAEHTIDELVFTASDEAWFRNTISTPLGEFGGRYGIARFDGSNWQIPRATICQDLALAGGTCRPAAVRIEPTEPENWDDVMAEYDRMSELYGSWGTASQNRSGQVVRGATMRTSGGGPITADCPQSWGAG